MTFLAPWALVVGAFAAMATVLLHLVARQRPAAYVLPTARFIADRRTLVSRVATRPRDLLLLALRVLLLLSAAAAFARPVLSPRREPRARIVLLDRSSAVAAGSDAIARVRTLLADEVPTRLVAFDSTATALAGDGSAVDSLARVSSDSLARQSNGASTTGSISSVLVAARRIGTEVGASADSVELVLVSPLVESELDAALDSVRAQWPGAITIVRVAARADTGREWTLERRIPADDPLGPAVAGVPVAASPRAVRLRRSALTSEDSALARAGGAVVRWDTAGVGTPAATALAMNGEVVVANLGHVERHMPGRTIARWADGTPAASEIVMGEGCLRTVGVGLPLAGDLPLRPAFQRVVRGLLAPCGAAPPTVPADSATVARLAGRGGAASGVALAGDLRRSSPLVPWLLGLAIACALAEIVVRARSAPETA